MKKLLIVIFLLCMCHIFSTVKANSNEFVTKEQYFANLKENFGHNYSSSCSYVSLEMLLMYYDTFSNDNIVPEKYEVKSNTILVSPGSFNDQNLYNDNDSYVEHINLYKEKSLHAKLISYQISYLINSCGYTINQISKSLLSLDLNGKIRILKNYLSDVCGYVEGVDYEIEYTLSNVRNYIIDKINNENEVIICGLGTIDNSDSHSVIAYEFSDNTIYMNYGYHSGSVNTSREDLTILNSGGEEVEYMYANAMTVNFNLDHIHSDNYSIQYNEKTHRNYCPCGYYEEKNHKFIINNNYGVCDSCNKSSSITFSPVIISDPDMGTNCGTYVDIYGGSYRGNDLLPGFTRLLYFDYNSPSTSRQDYDWYSGDESIASVTKFGTVVGVSPGETTIYASLKSNPSIIGVYEVSVLNTTLYNYYYIEMTTDTRPLEEQNGTEVTVLNNDPGLFTIHSGYTRALCFSNSNMYPSINDFIWEINSGKLTIDEFGIVHAGVVLEPTNVVVTGKHKNNLYVRASIIFTILPSE